MDLGFVGLGNMGGPMAANLVRAGHRLTVFDLSPAALDALVSAGAKAAVSPREVAASTEIVLTSLPTPPAVESVYLGADGLASGARSGQIFVELSSITPALARKVAAALAQKGVAVLDAPVSGGVGGAKAGTLAIMVGGDRDALERAEPILKTIGEKIFYVGPSGAGNTMKILNQLLVGVNTVAAVEVVALAAQSGLDTDLVGEIIGVSAGFSRSFGTRFPKGLQRDYKPGFAVDLMRKDLRLVTAFAEEVGIRLPMASQALHVFDETSSMGLGSQDIVASLETYVRSDG